jgi:hypothetical protein
VIDVHIPTTDGRELVLTRHTEPEASGPGHIQVAVQSATDRLRQLNCSKIPETADAGSRKRRTDRQTAPARDEHSVHVIRRRGLAWGVVAICLFSRNIVEAD